MSDAPSIPHSPVLLLRALMQAYAARPDVRKVAVVGNAPLEPDERRADEIDGADLTIRVNSFVLDAPGAPRTQGKDVHVALFGRGMRATRWVFDHYRDRLYVTNDIGMVYSRLRPWPQNWPADLGFMVIPNEQIVIPLCESMNWPWREKTLVPTTGTLAVAMALATFPEAETVVTGYSFIDNPNQTRWHHQSGDSGPIGGRHWIATESELFRRWLDEGRIRRLT